LITYKGAIFILWIDAILHTKKGSIITEVISSKDAIVNLIVQNMQYY